MQSKKKESGYQGAETISEQGEIVRPAEASILADDEERLRRFLSAVKPARNQLQTAAPETAPQKMARSRINKDVANDTLPKESAKPSYGSDENCKVPKWGERALLMLLKDKDKREYVTGDLQEEYEDILLRHGVKYANLWYWKQVVPSILSLGSLRFGSSLRRIAVVLIGEWIRRKIF
jgi:hypothetical protein